MAVTSPKQSNSSNNKKIDNKQEQREKELYKEREKLVRHLSPVTILALCDQQMPLQSREQIVQRCDCSTGDTWWPSRSPKLMRACAVPPDTRDVKGTPFRQTHHDYLLGQEAFCLCRTLWNVVLPL